MIRVRDIIVRLMALSASVLLLAGCEGRELCYDHSHKVPVSVEFDWSLAPDVEPSTMVVWFFPLDGSAPLRFELMGDGLASRGKFDAVVSVPPATYRVICHNGNTEFNVERGTGLDDYVITTYDVNVLSAMSNRAEDAPRPGDTEDQAVRSQASRLYAHTLDEPLTVRSGLSHKVVFTPAETTVLCDVRITGVENLRPDVEVSAILTGASEAWHPGSQSPTDVSVSVPFALSHCGTDCLKGTVLIFGLTGESHKLRIYTSYKYYYDFDVTDQIRRQDGRPVIDIALSGIRLPDVPGSGAGMSPGVSDWGELIEEPIIM